MTTTQDRSTDTHVPLDPRIAADVSRMLSELTGREISVATIQITPLRRAGRVSRVSASTPAGTRSVIVKRSSLAGARRSRLATTRWLPAVGLASIPPALLGTVTPPGADAVWLVYEDLGERTLHDQARDRGCVAAAARALAELHVRGAEHPLLHECRREGEDFGTPYFTANVGEALRRLEGTPGSARALTRTQRDVRDRLRAHLETLLTDGPRRGRVAADLAGPDTLLHGDPWTTNIIVEGDHQHRRVRLIDWERAGAGPFTYDLSTFLLRFERTQRPGAFAAYQDFLTRSGWHVPAAGELNLLFDSAERARYANRIVECLDVLAHDDASWAHDTLGEVAVWFDALRPVLAS